MPPGVAGVLVGGVTSVVPDVTEPEVAAPGVTLPGEGVVISVGGGAIVSGAGVPSSGVAGAAVSGAGEPSSGGVGIVRSELIGGAVAMMPGLTWLVPAKLVKLGGEIGTVKVPAEDSVGGVLGSATPDSAAPPGGGAPAGMGDCSASVDPGAAVPGI